MECWTIHSFFALAVAVAKKSQYWVFRGTSGVSSKKSTRCTRKGIMSNLMKGKVFGLTLPNKKTAMAPHLPNVIPKVI